MNATEFFKKRVGDFLQVLANTKEDFAPKQANEKKSLDECCNFIMNSVKQMNVAGLDDEDVYALAVEYYESDNPDPKLLKSVKCTVVSNQRSELTEEDKAALEQKAKDDYYAECLAKQREGNKPKKRTQAPQVEQPSLFG